MVNIPKCGHFEQEFNQFKFCLQMKKVLKKVRINNSSKRANIRSPVIFANVNFTLNNILKLIYWNMLNTNAKFVPKGTK